MVLKKDVLHCGVKRRWKWKMCVAFFRTHDLYITFLSNLNITLFLEMFGFRFKGGLHRDSL